MKQEFIKLDDGKIKWTYESEYTDMTNDKVEGTLGKKKYFNEVVFNSKEIAMQVLDADKEQTEKTLEFYQKELDKNKHDISKFSELQTLLLKISELNGELANLKAIPRELYEEQPKKYQKLWNAFSGARHVISEEIASIANDYQKMQEYQGAKKSYDFNLEQLEKIEDQRKLLEAL